MQDEKTGFWLCRDRRLLLDGRPLVMGILNVTPDSFSDGGWYAGTQAAVERGIEMAAQGADIIDVGGESTRPGAGAVPGPEERRRVVPVIAELRRRTGVLVSVDTTKAEVAREALAAGAHIVNDVSAASFDPDMTKVAAEARAGLILMHMKGTPRTMQADPRYDDVVAEVCGYLAARAADAERQGVPRECLAFDPGIGFGKTVEHNLLLLARLARIKALGRPVVVGLSRKSFLGKVTGREVGDRLAGSLAGLVFSVLHGVDVVRVHDVGESRDAARVACALRAAEKGAA